MNFLEAVEQRAAHAIDAAGVAPHPPGLGVVAERSQIAAQRHHREIAGEKARQCQHRMAVTAGRPHQERRQHEARIEFQNSPRLGEEQTEPRRTQAAFGPRIVPVSGHYFFLSPPVSAPSPVMETNISCIRSASLGSKLNQLWISESGEIFSILDIICCCSLSITAVCMGCTSGRPKNWRASRGVQSISMFTFMSAPDRAFDRRLTVSPRRAERS